MENGITTLQTQVTVYPILLNEQRQAVTRAVIPESVRDPYGWRPGDTLTLLDLGGVLVLSPQRSEIDAIAVKVAAQWAEDGETLETMLQALREERDRRAV